MELGTFISIGAVLIALITLILNRVDKAKQSSKENHQELIEYQLKELKDDYKDIASDVKEIKKMLLGSKDTFRDIVRKEMDEHIHIYHSKEV